jgi:hypothetical protein
MLAWLRQTNNRSKATKWTGHMCKKQKWNEEEITTKEWGQQDFSKLDEAEWSDHSETLA